MGDFEKALDALRERFGDDQDVAPIIETLNRYTGSELRKKAERADAAEQRVAELEQETRRLKKVPKLVHALKAAGVNFQALRLSEVHAIQHLENGFDFDGDEPSEDWLAKIISECALPTTRSR